MATKLRKFSRSRLSKFIAFSLTVVLITASMVMMNLIYDSEVNPEVLFVENYVQSETFVYGKLSRAVRDVINHFVNDTESIKPEPEYLYYITDGEKAKYNAGLDDILEHEKYLYLYENEQWSYGENTYKNVQSMFMMNLRCIWFLQRNTWGKCKCNGNRKKLASSDCSVNCNSGSFLYYVLLFDCGNREKGRR